MKNLSPQEIELLRRQFEKTNYGKSLIGQGAFDDEFMKHVSQMNVEAVTWNENMGKNNPKVHSVLGRQPTGQPIAPHSLSDAARWVRVHNGQSSNQSPIQSGVTGKRLNGIVRKSTADIFIENVLGIVLVVGFILGVAMIIIGIK